MRPQHIADELNAGTNSTASTLIQPVGEPPTGSHAWTAAQLLTALQTQHDIVSLSGHFSTGSLLASDYTTQLTPAQIGRAQVNLTNVLVLALGCHSGFSIPTPICWQALHRTRIGPNSSCARARPATFQHGLCLRRHRSDLLRRNAVLAPSPAAAHGHRPDLARTGPGGGQAQYLAETAQLTGIDQKTIIEPRSTACR